MSYVTPTGGSRRAAPKPAPSVGPVTMASWRQPIGGIRPTSTPPPRKR